MVRRSGQHRWDPASSTGQALETGDPLAAGNPPARAGPRFGIFVASRIDIQPTRDRVEPAPGSTGGPAPA